MNTLPKFLFLFQSIPIFINNTFFKKLHKLISSFIWNKKTPRIRKDFLQRPKSEGGMGLPHFKFYYWACNLRALSFWPRDYIPAWLHIEKKCCSPTSLSALLFSALPTTYSYSVNNPIVSQSLRIWSSIRKCFGWHFGSLRAPLIANHLFAPSLSDTKFSEWYNKGIHSFRDLFIVDKFPSFQQLQTKFDLPHSHHFRYLQLRDFVRKNTKSFPNLPDSTPMDSIFLPNPLTKGGISTLYNALSCLNGATSLDHLKTATINDLGTVITDELWTGALKRVHSSSVCARHGLLQFKVLHRLHLSKVKLCRMYPNINPACDRCGQSPASLAHMFWHCPRIVIYWQKIFQSFSDIMGRVVDPSPLTAIFGVKEPGLVLSSCQYTMITFISLLARRLILLNWKQARPPAHSALLKDVMQHLQLEKIKFSLRGCEDKFHQIWNPFIDYFNRSKPTLPAI